MNLAQIRIVADERERKSGIPRLLEAVGASIEIKTLPTGDYIVAPETVVERKSIHDFISSVFDGRLFDQCSRLREHFSSPVILLEGNADVIEEIVENPMIFYGAVSRVALDFKIPVMPTPNALHTSKLLISLASMRKDVKGPFMKKIKKSDDVQMQQLTSLGSLPGVGEKLAVRMLARFGTPLRVFNASSTELAKVGGMGIARARRIRGMLEAESKHLKPSSQKTLSDQ